MWDKERYHSDEKFRLRCISQARKYQETKAGKESLRRCHIKSLKSVAYKNWKKANPNYFSNYMKKKRMDARMKKICIQCFKNKVDKFATCSDCRKKMNK